MISTSSKHKGDNKLIVNGRVVGPRVETKRNRGSRAKITTKTKNAVTRSTPTRSRPNLALEDKLELSLDALMQRQGH